MFDNFDSMVWEDLDPSEMTTDELLENINSFETEAKSIGACIERIPEINYKPEYRALLLCMVSVCRAAVHCFDVELQKRGLERASNA